MEHQTFKHIKDGVPKGEPFVIAVGSREKGHSMDKPFTPFILKMLEQHRETLTARLEAAKLDEASDVGQTYYDIGRLDEQIKLLTTQTPMKPMSGDYLGFIRHWMQCKFRNGSQVTWGSLDPLHGGPALTPKLFEDLVHKAAVLALREYRGEEALRIAGRLTVSEEYTLDV